jgi:Domain of Unknown Function (DUF1080)
MRNLILPMILLALLALVPPVRGDDPQPPKGFTALFNGKDLTGWHGMFNFSPYQLAAMSEAERKGNIDELTSLAKKRWMVQNGELESKTDIPYLATDSEWGDVELLLECKLLQGKEPVLAGINLRSTSTREFTDIKLTPGGPWTSVRILQVGERTTMYVDGKLAIDHQRMVNTWDSKLPLLKKGSIELRADRPGVRWRNLFVREIPSTEANEILRKHGSAGFVDVFNGMDFTGWAGPIDGYEVKDGAIVCRPKKGGTIYTKDEYSDFMARVEFKLPPGGNNGLAIRYPGKGDTAYVGMCEIQVLDDTAKQYAKLDPRQYNGSAYGMVPAHRGYLRPVGEWNFEEVTIVGPTIKVELNGTRILDCDLSKVTDYMAKSPHPGKERKAGYFGFAGHNDPVAFRNIQIKRLNEN